MYLIFDRDKAEWVIRKELLIPDDENMVFNLDDESDCERVSDILNEYENEE